MNGLEKLEVLKVKLYVRLQIAFTKGAKDSEGAIS